jgi:hypothetical protein
MVMCALIFVVYIGTLPWLVKNYGIIIKDCQLFDNPLFLYSYATNYEPRLLVGCVN